MKIVHIADVHWRGLSRHEEYVIVFNKVFKKLRQIKPDVIYIGGDIVHSKTQGISPELIESLTWWFSEMASIAPTHVILGNHDGLLHNKDRQDAITPIIQAIDNENIFLYKESGVYPTGIPGFDWCVFSCFDEESWGDIKRSDNVSIALFHGAVRGSLTDADWSMEGEVPISFFDDYDFALLGDIHKRQFLNEKKTIAYCGSTVQQNYGEDQEKGFLVWDIESKDKFTTKFYPVENNFSFITVDWRGSVEKTLKACSEYPRQSRFRIRSDRYVTQADVRTLQKSLTKTKNASEVVFKIDNSFDSDRIQKITAESLNLRDASVQKRLLRDYYANLSLSTAEWQALDTMVDKYVSQVASLESDLRNVKWSIHNIKFDNTFSYGPGNFVNFDTLPGITGIFGKNARGKSSIIGTLAYGLFNTTDRGAIKNIHIINSRMSECSASIDISINNIPYRILRKTTKKQTKNGEWAPTTLNFYRLNVSGEIIEDLTEEQRRETEKIVRNMIGGPEEFLMTSLASQGEMNTFIREKASSRKNILSSFLDMTVFETLYDLAKKESNEIRIGTKSLSSENWNKKINTLAESINRRNKRLNAIKSSIEKAQDKIEELSKDLHQNSDFEYVGKHDIEKLKEKINKLELQKSQKENDLDLEKDNIFDIDQKILKINNFIDAFNVDEVREKKRAAAEAKEALWNIKSAFEVEKIELESKKKLAKKLEPCDCFVHKPSCQYVKKSDKHKRQVEDQRVRVNTLRTNLRDLESAYKKLAKENFEEQIEKYNKIVEKKVNLVTRISEGKVRIESLQNQIDNARSVLIEKKDQLNVDLKKFNAQSVDDSLSTLSKILHEKKNDLKKLDTERIQIINKIARDEAEISIARNNKEKYEDAKNKIKTYDLFLQATSKRGIPVQIINSLLPKINSEISKILKGVVGFTAVLEADLESNAMDIYIDYGDSRRIVELGSGMEKMIASLAIRVALINVSSLPKTNMLIIDEGFGSLDDINLESCGRLLRSLKKSFKNIIIISHIDAIKDIVDNTIEITKKGVNSYVSQG